MSRANVEKTVSLILGNEYLSLATSKDDKPWSSPIFYLLDQDLNFYFSSPRSTLHIKHIAANPHVSLSIYDSHDHPDDVDWVKIDGVAQELPTAYTEQVLDWYMKKRYPDEQQRLQNRIVLEDVMPPNGAHGLYVIQTKAIFTLDITAEDFSIDRRVIVDLNQVRERMAATS